MLLWSWNLGVGVGWGFFRINLVELFDFLNYMCALFWLKMELKYAHDFNILFHIVLVIVLIFFIYLFIYF